MDSGVTPNPRFPALFAGGDYVQGLPNGGLTDCDNHGTVVASIIGAAPSNPAGRPAPKPAGVGAPPRTAGSAGQPGAHQCTTGPAAAIDGDRDGPATSPAASATPTAGGRRPSARARRPGLGATAGARPAARRPGRGGGCRPRRRPDLHPAVLERLLARASHTGRSKSYTARPAT